MVELLIVLAAIIILATALWVRSQRRGSAEARPDDAGGRVVVGVARPATAGPLGKIAAALARPVRGEVTPLTVVTTSASTSSRSGAEQSLRRCEATIREEGVDARGRLRIATSLSEGVLHGLVEQQATALILGWPTVRGSGRLTSALEEVVARSPVPVLIARMDHQRWDRIVLRVPSEPVTPGLRASLRLAIRTAERLAARHAIEVGCTRLVTPHRRDPAQLFIAPVAPEEAFSRAAARLEDDGDVLLALCHGSRAAEARPLMPSATALYSPGDTGEIDLHAPLPRDPSPRAPAQLSAADADPWVAARLGAESRR